MRRTARRLIILVSPSLLLSASSVTAQSPTAEGGRPVKLGGALGAVVPFGDFGDIASLGFHLTGLLELVRPTLPVGLRTEVMYQRHGLDEDIVQANNAHGTVWSFIGNITFPIGDSTATARPYLIGGLGIYRSKQSGEIGGRKVSGEADTDLGLNGGGGFAFRLTGFDAFVEARIHHTFGGQELNGNFIPFSFGFRF